MGTIVVVDRTTGAVERADVSSTGEGGTCDPTPCGSRWPAITPDGRFVAFYSDHANLVPGDTNGQPDVFVRDRLAGTTERVSVRTDGAQSDIGGLNRYADRLGLSADGRFVTFASAAGDLVPGLSIGTNRIYVRDRQLQVTELVSVSSAGIAGNSDARQPSISADGRLVAFASFANNLVPGDLERVGGRLRARPGGRHHRAREPVRRRCSGVVPVGHLRPGVRPGPGHQRRRPVRRLPVARNQPDPRRCQRRPGRRVHPRSADAHDAAAQPVDRRAAGQRQQRRGALHGRSDADGSERRRRRRGLRLRRHQPGARRHQRPRGRLRARSARREPRGRRFGTVSRLGDDHEPARVRDVRRQPVARSRRSFAGGPLGLRRRLSRHRHRRRRTGLARLRRARHLHGHAGRDQRDADVDGGQHAGADPATAGADAPDDASVRAARRPHQRGGRRLSAGRGRRRLGPRPGGAAGRAHGSPRRSGAGERRRSHRRRPDRSARADRVLHLGVCAGVLHAVCLHGGRRLGPRDLHGDRARRGQGLGRLLRAVPGAGQRAAARQQRRALHRHGRRAR